MLSQADQIQPRVTVGSGRGRQCHQGELDQITRYPYWELFGTLTFKGSVVPTSGVRYKMAFAFLRESARLAKTSFSRLVWVLRDEQGEMTQRDHFHFLQGGARFPLNPSTNFRVMALWERVGGGHARCAIYNRELAGAEYVSKCLSGEGTKAAHQYELDKFGWTERPPILSASLVRYLAAQQRRDQRRAGTAQAVTVLGEQHGPAVTRHPVISTPDGNGPRGPETDKPRHSLIEHSSLLWKLGRHPYGCDQGGHGG